jgi:hypothetical protein
MKKIREAISGRGWMEGDPSKNHTVGLWVFGTLEVLLGIFCFSLAMLLLIVVSSRGLHGVKPIHFWIAQALLFFLTGWLIVMGLGSIKAKRWARVLMLVGSWAAVFFGTLCLALILYVLPEIYIVFTDVGLFPPLTALGVLYVAVSILILLMLVFPLASIAFYRLKGVAGTCERRNPEPCWTDRCPLPLLAMSFVSALGCLTLFAGATNNFAVLLFGHVVNGLPGAGVLTLVSAAFGYVGWGAYTRRMHAWWVAYTLVVLISSSMMLTFAGTDIDTLYIKMGYSTEQIARLQNLYPFNSVILTLLSFLWGVMACIYLVWVRDGFRPVKTEAVVKSYQQRKAEEAAAEPEEPKQPRMRLD